MANGAPMFSDIGKIDGVLKPEPLQANRDRGGNPGQTKSDQAPEPEVAAVKEDEDSETVSQRLLDIRI